MDPQSIESIQNGLEQIKDNSEKVRFIIDFMRLALTQKGQPRFRDFWEAKKMCLDAFKHVENPILRSNLWSEYIELTQEAKRLKEILDEQSSFAIEQLELAIEAIGKDLDSEAEKIKAMPRVEFPKEAHTLRDREKVYNQKQLEINFLQTTAQRIGALRKEIIQTEMRIRFKNRMLQKLSTLGDKVFPRKKQLCAEISHAFFEDVEQFATNFKAEKAKKSAPLYVLKEEIKAFQKMAKVLSLNTDCFTKCRKILSECFEAVKKKEKERKREYVEKKEKCSQNFEEIGQKVKEFGKWVEEEEFSFEKLEERQSSILQLIKDTPLVRDQVRFLKEELQKFRKAADKKLVLKEQGEKQKSLEEEKKIKEEIKQLFDEYKSLIQNGGASEAISQAELSLKEKSDRLPLSSDEEVQLILLQEDLFQILLDKKEEECLQESKHEIKLRNLEDLLDEKIDFRERIKNRLEDFRRLTGSSGLDFEKAMLYRECIEKERTRFEQLNDSIESLEEQLTEIEDLEV